ncbi:hypothetical protein AAC387_Pa04g2928 [Persea americana]
MKKSHAVKKRDLVELLLIDPVIHHLVRFPALSRDEGLALHHLYVVAGARGGGRPAGGEEEAVILDVVVLAVKLLGLVFVHVVVVGVSRASDGGRDGADQGSLPCARMALHSYDQRT